MKKLYYIKERHNPQLGIYYVPMGKRFKKEVKDKSLYGDNYYLSFETEQEYKKALKILRERGERISTGAW